MLRVALVLSVLLSVPALAAGAPSVRTGDVGFNPAGFVVDGGVDDGGVPASVHVEFGPTTDYGQRGPDSAVPAATGEQGVTATSTATLTSDPPLEQATTYHYRLVLTVDGTDYSGDDRTFGTGTFTTFDSIPTPGTWKRAKHAAPARKDRTVKISVLVYGCAPFQYAQVKRTRHAVIITAIYGRLVGRGPYIFTPSCPMPMTVTRKIPIGGRLGRRVVKDGATSPPKVRYGNQ